MFIKIKIKTSCFLKTLDNFKFFSKDIDPSMGYGELNSESLASRFEPMFQIVCGARSVLNNKRREGG